jgi:hypothetical protein
VFPASLAAFALECVHRHYFAYPASNFLVRVSQCWGWPATYCPAHQSIAPVRQPISGVDSSQGMFVTMLKLFIQAYCTNVAFCRLTVGPNQMSCSWPTFERVNVLLLQVCIPILGTTCDFKKLFAAVLGCSAAQDMATVSTAAAADISGVAAMQAVFAPSQLSNRQAYHINVACSCPGTAVCPFRCDGTVDWAHSLAWLSAQRAYQLSSMHSVSHPHFSSYKLS